MKILRTTLWVMLVALLIPNLGFTQDTRQSYTVHLDHVKPSMIAEYERISKELIAQSKKHNSNFGWLTLVTDEFDYFYVSPIKNMAQLDGNPFAGLAEKMGAAEMGKIFSEMDKCYDDHINYVITLDKELSYMPNGITQTPEGQPFRKNTLYYVAPQNYAAAEQLAKDFKALYTKKGSKVNYRIYRSGYGSDGTYFMVAIAAKDAMEYERMDAENAQLLGAEGQQLAGRLLSLISKTKTITGAIRADLSYMPSN